MATKARPFTGAGASTGVEVWRVENLAPVLVVQQQGLFYTGDSYVILNTKASSSGAKSYDVHFWLGSETSQDEAGAAAIFATEIDDVLGGKAKQYRQVQGAESPEFFEVFGGTVQYREGGVKSGFRHVESAEAPPPALLRVKGKVHARVSEVPAEISSLNSGDIFILDLNDKLYLWSGRDANVQEKTRAREVLTALKEHRNGKPQVVVIQEGEEEANAFYVNLGAVEPESVTIQPAVADEATADGKAFSQTHLYKVADKADGKEVTISEVQQHPLTRAALESDSTYVFAADGWLFIWHGKDASSSERKASLSLATQLLRELQLPPSTPVQLVKDGMEDLTFKQHFDWSAPHQKPATNGGDAPKTPAKESSDAKTLDAPADPAATSTLSSKSPGASASTHSTPVPNPMTVDGDSPVTKSTAKKTKKTAAPAAQEKERNAAAEPTEEDSTPGKQELDAPATSNKIKSISKQLTPGNEATFIPKPVVNEPSLPPKPAEEIKFAPGKDVFPYDKLKEMRADAGVDMTRKEDYLSSDEFQKVFKKTVEEFKAQPKWRQVQAKKDVGLF